MFVSASVEEFLRRSDAAYIVLPHARACNAKVAVYLADDRPIQAVVPVDSQVDMVRLAKLAGAKELRMARVDELEWLFPDCEPGAMAPLGPAYRQPVFVDERLAKDAEIVFNGGTFDSAVAMPFDDFRALTQPVIGRFAAEP